MRAPTEVRRTGRSTALRCSFLDAFASEPSSCRQHMAQLLSQPTAHSAGDIWWHSAGALLLGAAIARQADLAQMILCREPAAAEEPHSGRGGWRLAHYAARHSAAAVLRLVQQAAHGLEDCCDAVGRYPIFYAARPHYGATVRLLAQPAPHTALIADRFGHCALAGALYRGSAAATHAMLAALPVAAAAALLPSQAVQGLTRAECFRASHYSTVVRSLLPVVPADCMLLALQRSLDAYEPAAGLLVDALLHYLPLTQQQWALVPAYTPGLGRAVHAVLTQPAGQAEQLAARLEAGHALRLRRALGALCLLRAQRQLGTELPPQLTNQILRRVE